MVIVEHSADAVFGRVATVGVLALQGAVREHQRAIERCGAVSLAVKQPAQLELIDGLIIPGGESTVIGKLIEAWGLVEPIRRLAADGVPIFGTCAGLVLLAKEAVESNPYLLGIMDIKARRNAFGRQVDSFEADLDIGPLEPSSYRAVFIRAPWVEAAGKGVSVLAKWRDRPVLVEQGHNLACAFHPELTDDLRLHRYFIAKVAAKRISGRQ
jgi:pyridoxal 5'-phosphate synthase pdxT subunit